MGPSGRTENCCHCCAQRGSCASPALLGALPWRTLLQLNIWFSKCLCNTPFFFYFFLPQMLLELCWLTCIWRSSALPSWVTQQASPLILGPTDESTPRHCCCRGSDLSFMRWRQGPRWLRALLAAGSEGVAVCFRSDQVPGPSAGRLLYKCPVGVNRLLYRSVLSPQRKVKCSVAFQLQWAPHPEGPAGFDGGC